LRGELDHADVAAPIGHRAVDAGAVDDEFVCQDEMMHRDRRAIGHRRPDPGRCHMQVLEDPAGDRRPLVIADVKTIDAVARPVHRIAIARQYARVRCQGGERRQFDKAMKGHIGLRLGVERDRPRQLALTVGFVEIKHFPVP
jgi:hypothetical protein